MDCCGLGCLCHLGSYRYRRRHHHDHAECHRRQICCHRPNHGRAADPYGRLFLRRRGGVTGSISNLDPLFAEGATGITIVLVMVPFMFVGFDIIPQAAEEIDLPYRDIGTALILSVMMAIAWYALIIIGVGLVMDGDTLAAADLVTAEANGVIYGELGETVLLVTGLAGIVTSWNASDCRCQPGPLCHGKGGHAPSSAGRSPSPLPHPQKCDSADWGAVCDLTIVRSAGTGLAGECRRARHRCGLCLRCPILSGAAQNEPELERPYQAPGGSFTGYLALVLSVAIGALYFPGSPSALIWPQEWAIIVFWIILGALLFGLSRLSSRAD